MHRRRRLVIGLGLVSVAIFLFWWSRRQSPRLPESREQPHAPAEVAAPETAPRSADAPVPVDPLPTTIAPDWVVTFDRLAFGTRWLGPQPAELAAFRDWTIRYEAANSTVAQDALETEGVALAIARRPVFLRLIETDPERALELTVPATTRQQLPAAVAAELESRVSGVGSYAVVPVEPEIEAVQTEPGGHEHPEQRFVRVAGVTYSAHAYGRRRSQLSEERVSLHGVALDGHLAVHPSPLRVLDMGEVPAGPLEMVDPATGAPVDATGITANSSAPQLVEFHGRWWALADPQLLGRLERSLRALETLPGPVAPPFEPGVLIEPPIAAATPTAWTTGTKRLLVIRVDFSDVTGEPRNSANGTTISQTYAQGVVNNDVRPFYVEASYNQTTLDTTVTSRVYRMPKTAATYAQAYDLMGLYEDAVAAARANHNPDNFELVQIVFSYIGPSRISGSKFGFGGVAFRGGKQSFINGYYTFDVVAHEIGHNYGLAHANLWSSGGSPISDNAGSQEYGDIYDVMGGYNGVADRRHHFNPWFKNELGWLPDSAVTFAGTSGTYRVHRFDAVDAPQTQPMALNVFRDGCRSYWIGNRRAPGGAMANSAYVQWGFYGMQQSQLIDMVPGGGDIFSPHDLSDAGLAVGMMLDDSINGVTLRTVASGGSSPSEYIDVEVTVVAPARNIVAHWGEAEAVQVPLGVRDLVAIAAGDEHGLARRRNGELVTWGDNDSEGPNRFGELSLPWQAYQPFASFTAGGDSSGIVLNDGTVVVWGIAEFGQNNIPAGLNNVKQLALGGDHALALKNDGTVVAWGSNAKGQISIPAGLTGVKALSAGRDMTLVLLENGTVQHWGVNAAQLPGGLTNVIAVAAGWGHGVALKSDGTVVAWGDNSDGQASVPVGLANVKQIGAGHLHSVALKNDGTIVAWGSDEFRQVTVPRGLPKVDTIAVAENHALALLPGTSAMLLLAQSGNQTVNSGNEIVFGVSVDSVGSPIYRWQRRAAGSSVWSDLADIDGISGSASARLRLLSTAYSMNADEFRCVIADGVAPEITSSPAKLMVIPRPLQLARHPDDREIVLGDVSTFSVEANGEPAYVYRWQRRQPGESAWTDLINGSGISGAGTRALTVSGVSLAQQGEQFRCVVQDLANRVVTSNAAGLTVVFAAPDGAFPTGRRSATAGEAMTLSVPSAPAPWTQYQWRHNGRAIAGATSATLTIDAVTADNAGFYDVVLSDGLGSESISWARSVEVQPATYGNEFRVDSLFLPLFERKDGSVEVALVAPDGRIYIAGRLPLVNGRHRGNFVRLWADGSLDETFSPPPINGVIRTIVPMADGRLIVAGDFGFVGDIYSKSVVRLNADGSIDSSFKPQGSIDGAVNAVAVRADGSLVVGGSFGIYQSAARLGLARLRPDGTLDPASHATPLFTSRVVVSAIAVQPDGKMVLGGSFGEGGWPLSRIHADGTRDESFVAQTEGSYLSCRQVLLQPDGRIVAVFDAAYGLKRYESSGVPDSTFSYSGGSYQLVAALQGERVVLATGGEIERLDANGAIDPSFPTVLANDGRVRALAVLGDGGILAVGEFSRVQGALRSGIVRLQADGVLDSGFAPGVRAPGVVWALLPAENGDWIVGGDFTHVNDFPAPNIVRLRDDGSVVESFSAVGGFDRKVSALARAPNGGIIAGGEFTSYGGLERRGVARLNADGTLDATFGPPRMTEDYTSRRPSALAVLPSRRVMVAGDFYVGFEADFGDLVRLTPSGYLDKAFRTDVRLNESSVQAIAIDSAGRLVVGGDMRFGSSYPYHSVRVGRFLTDGSVDAGFAETLFGSAVAVAPLAGDRVLVAGDFVVSQQSPPARLVRLHADGTIDPMFQLTLTGESRVTALAVQADERILVGGRLYSQNGLRHLLRINSDGSLDPTFSVEGLGGYSAEINVLALTANGRIMVGGPWLPADAEGYGLVRLRKPGHPPVITGQPSPQEVPAGSAVSVTVSASSADTTVYRWQRNGTDIPGATTATFTLSAAQLFHAGEYAVVIRNPDGSVTSSVAKLAVVEPPSSDARLMNLSTRAVALTGDNVLIPGFVIAGPGNKQLLIRAVGPTLGSFGVAGTLADPRMTLKRWNGLAYDDIATNDNWGTNPNAAAIATKAEELFAFPLGAGSADAALLTDLAPGQYSVVANGADAQTGVAIVELYDADPNGGTARLINISNRGYVGTGDSIMIPGYVISSEGPKTLLVRAVGPTLAQFGVSGVLADPTLTIYRRVNNVEEPILANDNWSIGPGAQRTRDVAAQVNAFALPDGSKDAAFVITLNPGIYTVHARGTNNTTGVALVEIYAVP